ncbi:MAG: DUF3726 domain-containing protein [Paracoccaceae bacterium]
MLNLSLNEVEATSKRAAKGAGYSWGLAEEAGKATRWLCIQGYDGISVLARLLERELAANPQAHRPKNLDHEWQADHALCPLIAGCALSDCAAQLQSGKTILHDVEAPAMLLPFASYAARRIEKVVCIEIDDLELHCDGIYVDQTQDVLTRAERVLLTIKEKVTVRAHPAQTRAFPQDEAWKILSDFAHRTYAPATEDSRMRGAGAGLSDND